MSPVKNKKSSRILIAAAALALAVAVGVTFAFMYKKIQKENTLIPAKVSCTVHEKLNGTEYTSGVHSGTKKTDIKVENTGNIAAFIRLRVVSNWVDSDGNVVGIASKMPSITLNENWIKGSNDTYYYTLPVDPSAYTEALCDAVALEETTDRSENTVYQTIELIAEAVQSLPSDAATQSWGVTISDNKITAAP